MAWTRRAKVTLLCVGGCAAAIAVVALRHERRATPRAASGAGEPSVRLRGFVSDRLLVDDGPALQLFRKTPRGPEALRAGDSAGAGDVVQLVYRSGGARHGAIISHDGHGHVSLHWPPRVGAPTTLGPRARPLPYAFELDDAPRFERFLFVVAHAPLDVAALLTRAGTLGGSARAELALPGGARVAAELLINKR